MKKLLFAATILAATLAASTAHADDQGTGYNRYGFSTPQPSQETVQQFQAQETNNAYDQSTSYNRYGVAAPQHAVEVPEPTQEEIDAYTGGQVRYAQAQAKPVDPEQAAREQAQIQSLLDAFGITYEEAHALGIL